MVFHRVLGVCPERNTSSRQDRPGALDELSLLSLVNGQRTDGVAAAALVSAGRDVIVLLGRTREAGYVLMALGRFAEAIQHSGADVVPKIVMGGSNGQGNNGSVIETLLALLLSAAPPLTGAR